MDFEGDGKLREGGLWMEWGKGVHRTTSELKTKVGRRMDLLKKLGEVSLWNDEIGEGLMTKKIKSKLDGTIFFINYDVLGPYSNWNHSKIPMLTHSIKNKKHY